MKKDRKTFLLHASHIENALALYLKSYFPEAVEIGGVDIDFPISARDQIFNCTVYLESQPKEKDVQEITVEFEPVDPE